MLNNTFETTDLKNKEYNLSEKYVFDEQKALESMGIEKSGFYELTFYEYRNNYIIKKNLSYERRQNLYIKKVIRIKSL